MEPSFDLDINNYTTDDLMRFFKLEDNYSLEDLNIKEEKLATSILSVDNQKYNSKMKFDIINFINSFIQSFICFGYIFFLIGKYGPLLRIYFESYFKCSVIF